MYPGTPINSHAANEIPSMNCPNSATTTYPTTSKINTGMAISHSFNVSIISHLLIIGSTERMKKGVIKLEQTALQVLPWQGILNSPNTAWAVFAMVLLIFVMYQNGKREQMYHDTMDTTIKEHGQTIAKQTETLNGINTTLIRMNDTISDVKNRVEDIEDVIFKKGGTPT